MISRRTLLTMLGGALLPVALIGAAPAAAAPAPYWHLSSSAAPANLAPGGEGKVLVTASNLGDAATSGPVTISDSLPAGLEATKVVAEDSRTQAALTCSAPTAVPLSCTQGGAAAPVQPLGGLTMRITVKVPPSQPSGTVLQNQATVSGGGAPAATASEPVRVDEHPATFGVEKYSLKPEEEGGAPDAQAGSHPFQLTTSLVLNVTASEEPVAQVKNAQFSLPAGLLGNPIAIPRCRQTDFNTILPQSQSANLCGPQTAVGVAEVSLFEPVIGFGNHPLHQTVPVFNIEPANGEPARLGFVAFKDPVVLETSVRTGSDYGVTVTAKNTSQSAGLISSLVTIWGVPGDPRHHVDRGWECVGGGGSLPPSFPNCEEQAPLPEVPFLSMPTSCGSALQAPAQVQSWVPGTPFAAPFESEFREALEGCSALEFSPSLTASTSAQAASTPSGLDVNVNLPQVETPTGLAQSTVKSTTVTLPEGMQLNPGAANGLDACSAFEIGLEGGVSETAQTENDHFSPDAPLCGDAAKVGTVSIKSPDLENRLTGFVYLAREHTNPFEAPLVIYLTARDPVSGVIVKLAGSVTPDPATGRLVTTFDNTPQVPFEELSTKFFDGGRASVATPALCGSYTTGATMTPWSGNASAAPSAAFDITSGPGGGPCPSNPRGFAPSFQAGTSNPQAGAFTPFTLTINRPDGDQALQSLSVHLPSGIAGIIASVTPCPAAQAQSNSCGPESLIGHSTASSGLGGEPFTLPGNVYLTGPYKGAPFGIADVTPAVAGPFNLGNVIVLSTIAVDRDTAAVTITSDPFPTMLKGVPVQLKQINVTVDRAGSQPGNFNRFQFNPTNCNPLMITATLNGDQGASHPVSSPFKVSNCASLPFKPTFTASVDGQASKANGASLRVRVTSEPGQANIGKTNLSLPTALPSRLTTIQKACLDSVFEVNPAGCDEGSNIGTATVTTPVFKNPLTGPAYLVSHGGAAFPDIEFVLQGEGITLVLKGKTDIKKGITYSRFESLPDAPVTSFETVLPTGPHSALTANVPEAKHYSLCGQKLVIPTTLTGQNGALVTQQTKVAITGCGAVKGFKQTRASKLKKALKHCRKKFAHKKQKRLSCERQARKRYGAHHHKKGHHKKH